MSRPGEGAGPGRDDDRVPRDRHAGNTSACSGALLYTSLPVPVAHRGVVVARVSGAATSTCPRVRPLKLTAQRFLKLGCTVKAVRGAVRVTAAGTGGTTHTATFSGGAVKVTQASETQRIGKARRKVTVLVTAASLAGPAPTGCAKKRGRQKAGRHLSAVGASPFRTVGRRATVTPAPSGARWATEERCGGTYVRVTRGTVAVHDVTRRRVVALKARHGYLAPARR